jgi:hypothetical protein
MVIQEIREAIATSSNPDALNSVETTLRIPQLKHSPPFIGITARKPKATKEFAAFLSVNQKRIIKLTN